MICSALSVLVPQLLAIVLWAAPPPLVQAGHRQSNLLLADSDQRGASQKGSAKLSRREDEAKAIRIVERFLAARSAKDLRAIVDGEARKWYSALYMVANSSTDLDPASFFEELATLESEFDNPQPNTGCTIRAGTHEDRVELVPALFPFVPSAKVRARLIDTRQKLDAGMVLVAKCNSKAEQLILVDVARERVLANSERLLRLPYTRRLLEDDPKTTLAVTIETYPVGATLDWDAARHRLPFTLRGIIPEADIEGTIRAPNHAPYHLSHLATPTDSVRSTIHSLSWFVILFPEEEHRAP